MPARPPRPQPVVSITPKPRTPSEVTPRSIPVPKPGRSTDDPVTHTLAELAARAQKASVVADATRVAPQPVAPRSDINPRAAVIGRAPGAVGRGLRPINPLADAERYEALEMMRQQTTVAEKVKRRAERAALVARGRALG